MLLWRDVRSNVAFGLNFKHQPRASAEARKDRVDAAIEAVGLKHLARSYPAQISGRIGAACGSGSRPGTRTRPAFTDEPFAALDALTRAQMQSLLITLVQQWKAAVLWL